MRGRGTLKERRKLAGITLRSFHYKTINIFIYIHVFFLKKSKQTISLSALYNILEVQMNTFKCRHIYKTHISFCLLYMFTCFIAVTRASFIDILLIQKHLPHRNNIQTTSEILFLTSKKIIHAPGVFFQ